MIIDVSRERSELIWQDTGLAVRKKVIKLLKDIFAKSNKKGMRQDICCKMVEMISDDDHVVRVSFDIPDT